MDSASRSLVLGIAAAFFIFFVMITVSATIESGFSIFSVISFGIIALIGSAIIGGMRSPPGDDE